MRNLSNHHSNLNRLVSLVISFALTFNTLGPLPLAYGQGMVQTTLNLPAPGTMVVSSRSFNPMVISGITLYPNDPLKFDFLVDPGDMSLPEEEFKKEGEKLIRYFMAALTIPEEQLWVNLSPYEKDRIIPEPLGSTEMGRDLLAQDYLLKQLASSLMYPESELGKKFWQNVYEKAKARYGTIEIPVSTFNKIWIVPQKADIYEQGASAFVVNSRLKVMLEEDYVALNQSAESKAAENKDTASQLSSEQIREILLPEIEREVNEGETFAALRQMYNSMILATWYKMRLRDSLLGQVYADQNKIHGIDLEDKSIKEDIYQQYMEAFRKGVYSYIKEEVDPATEEVIPRKYFSGGFQAAGTSASSPIDLRKVMRRVDAPQEFLLEKFGGGQIITASFIENSTPFELRKASFSAKGQKTIAAIMAVMSLCGLGGCGGGGGGGGEVGEGTGASDRTFEEIVDSMPTENLLAELDRLVAEGPASFDNQAIAIQEIYERHLANDGGITDEKISRIVQDFVVPRLQILQNADNPLVLTESEGIAFFELAALGDIILEADLMKDGFSSQTMNNNFQRFLLYLLLAAQNAGFDQTFSFDGQQKTILEIVQAANARTGVETEKMFLGGILASWIANNVGFHEEFISYVLNDLRAADQELALLTALQSPSLEFFRMFAEQLQRGTEPLPRQLSFVALMFQMITPNLWDNHMSVEDKDVIRKLFLDKLKTESNVLLMEYYIFAAARTGETIFLQEFNNIVLSTEARITLDIKSTAVFGISDIGGAAGADVLKALYHHNLVKNNVILREKIVHRLMLNARYNPLSDAVGMFLNNQAEDLAMRKAAIVGLVARTTIATIEIPGKEEIPGIKAAIQFVADNDPNPDFRNFARRALQSLSDGTFFAKPSEVTTEFILFYNRVSQGQPVILEKTFSFPTGQSIIYLQSVVNGITLNYSFNPRTKKLEIEVVEDKPSDAEEPVSEKPDTVGGIDLNAEFLNLQIRRDENGVPLPLPLQPIRQMHIDGFAPVIINIAPAVNLPLLLGEKGENAASPAG